MKPERNQSAFASRFAAALLLTVGSQLIVANSATPQSNGTENLLTARPISDLDQGTSGDGNSEQPSFAIAKAGAAILLPLKLAGHEYRFLLDTGSSFHIFDTTLKRHLGKRLHVEEVGTAEKSLTVDFYRPPAANIGNLPLPPGGDVACMDLTTLRRLVGKDVRGIIGMPLLEHHIVQMNLNEGRVSILSPTAKPRQQWGAAIPMQYNRFTGPRIEASLPGNMKRSFMVDTGLNLTGILAKNCFGLLVDQHELRVTAERTAFSAGGNRPCKLGILNEFALGKSVTRS